MAQPVSTGAVAPPSTRSLDRRPDSRLRSAVTTVVLLITAGYTYLDYWNYSRSWHAGGTDWLDLLAGRGFAPAQYRIGVIRLAALLADLTHTGLRHMFALIDGLSLLASLLLLFHFLMDDSNGDGDDMSAGDARREELVRWLKVSLGFGVVLVYLLWSFWYQKPETDPTLLLLVLSAAALRSRRAVLAAPALILLAAVGATVRADAMVAFHLGCLLVCVLPQGRSLPLGRTVQGIASGLAALAAAGVQYWIMHRLYPGAPKQVESLQLLHNLIWPEGYLAIVLALFPWWLTLWLAGRRWAALDGWSLALVTASVAHFAMFFTLGTAVEVRVFLPYALLVVPLSARLIAGSIAREPLPAPVV